MRAGVLPRLIKRARQSGPRHCLTTSTCLMSSVPTGVTALGALLKLCRSRLFDRPACDRPMSGIAAINGEASARFRTSRRVIFVFVILTMNQWNSDIEGHGHIPKAARAVSGRREKIGRATVFDQQEWAFELSHGLCCPVVPAKRARPGFGAFSQLPAQPVLRSRMNPRVFLADEFAGHILGDHLVAFSGFPDERILDLTEPVSGEQATPIRLFERAAMHRGSVSSNGTPLRVRVNRTRMTRIQQINADENRKTSTKIRHISVIRVLLTRHIKKPPLTLIMRHSSLVLEPPYVNCIPLIGTE